MTINLRPAGPGRLSCPGLIPTKQTLAGRLVKGRQTLKVNAIRRDFEIVKQTLYAPGQVSMEISRSTIPMNNGHYTPVKFRT